MTSTRWIHSRRNYDVPAKKAGDVMRLRFAVGALAGVWFAALLLAGVGFRVEYGQWPGVVDWFLVTPLVALFALPMALVQQLGMDFQGGSPALLPLFFGFWSLLIVLHSLALVTRRRPYFAMVAAVLALPAWKWAVYAVGLMGV